MPRKNNFLVFKELHTENQNQSFNKKPRTMSTVIGRFLSVSVKSLLVVSAVCAFFKLYLHYYNPPFPIRIPTPQNGGTAPKPLQPNPPTSPFPRIFSHYPSLYKIHTTDRQGSSEQVRCPTVVGRLIGKNAILLQRFGVLRFLPFSQLAEILPLPILRIP